jgi:peptide/nickel transport system permease protein
MQLEYLGVWGIIGGLLLAFWPVWASLAVVLAASLAFKPRLGLYGQLFDSGVGIAGVMICLFWTFTAIYAPVISPLDQLAHNTVKKEALPGAVEPQSGQAFLLGGDRLARDIFSRMVFGSQIVLVIAPAATLFALMVGTRLGVAAGY